MGIIFNMKKEIVIAAYDRDLHWLSRLNSDVKKTIYRKGNRGDDINEIYIENNKGRCVHTFFNHIFENYNNLSDVTYFAQDYPFDHWENIVEIINDSPTLQKEQLKIGGYCGYHWNSIQTPSPNGGIMWALSPSTHHGYGNILYCDSNGQPQNSNPLIDVDKYWNLFFESNPPNRYEFIPGGHFAITKEHIKIRSKEFYKSVVGFLLDEEVAPWIIERLECYIFNPKYSTNIN
jgi:hypothetical protein